MAVAQTKNLHYIFCKVNANGDKLFTLLEPHSSFQFHYRLLTMKTFIEIALYSYTLWYSEICATAWSVKYVPLLGQRSVNGIHY